VPRFAILSHDHPHIHWDLLLEEGNVLRAFRLEGPPAPGRTFEAERINDHRLIYLEYEGPISGDRGEVRQWDAGQFEWSVDATERMVVSLVGRNFQGELELTRRMSDSSDSGQNLWTVCCSAADSGPAGTSDIR
jgi:hypothetical protein